MNKLIKKILNWICHFLTVVLNRGQRFICYQEGLRMWTLPKGKLTDEEKNDFKRHKKYLKQFGFHAVKRDFFVFRKYLIDKGRDPMYIIPSYVVHNYLTAFFNPITYDAYFSDKNFFDKILPTSHLPKTFFRRINGQWFDADYKPLSFLRIMEELKDRNNIKSIIVKPSRDSSSGKGVKLFNNENGKWVEFNGSVSFFENISQNYWKDSDLIVQEVIEQSPYISQFSSTSVNTFRIVIYNSLIDNNQYLIWAGLRIGKNGSILDNNHAGGLMFGLDSRGKISSYGTDQYGKKTGFFNGIDFENGEFIIPEFSSIINFAKSTSINLLPNRFIAFDIALDKNNKPLIIEYNLRAYGGWACQFAGDYMFGEKTDEILKILSQYSREIEKFFYKIN